MWHVALSWPARAWSKPVVFEPAYYVVPHANDARVAFASACDNAFDNVDNGDVYICIYIYWKAKVGIALYHSLDDE